MIKRVFAGFGLLMFLLLALSGCAADGSELGHCSVYLTLCFLSVTLLGGYIALIEKKSPWMIGLFTCISVVNLGYAWLASAQTVPLALHANRLAYLGSVFLPLCMLMIIRSVSQLHKSRALPFVLLGVATVMFCITATQGILPWYYRSVSLEFVGGTTLLHKDYGPLHPLYLLYLLGYFGAMVATVTLAIRRKQLDSPVHTVFLAVAALINIGVWGAEQLVSMDFEILSVSYVISEVLLLALNLMLQETDKRLTAERKRLEAATAKSAPTFSEDEIQSFKNGLAQLTPTEHTVYTLYVEGQSSKAILEQLNIKENTLKYHTRNIYSKLGVRSRKQMLALAALPSDN